MMNNKKLLALLLAGMMCMSVTACNKKEELSEEELAAQAAIETENKEILMNDYRGGVKRTLALKNSILELVDTMKANNVTVRENNPNSFWDKDDYQDFVTNFMNTAIINDTQWFNEEEADWEQTYSYICSQASSYTQATDGGYALKNGISITRNEKDDYSISGIKSGSVHTGNSSYEGTANYRILYDCDKDWCKAYMSVTVDRNIAPVTAELFEYARIDNDTFAIQTGNERILIKLESADSDTDIRQRTIKEFYYSKLVSDGARTTFEPFETLAEYDAGNSNLYSSANVKTNETMKQYPELNAKGDVATLYSKNDSLFLSEILFASEGEDTESETDDSKKEEKKKSKNEETGISATDKAREWVFEDKALQQALCYKDGSLVVTTYNKLSEKYERFEYAVAGTDEKITRELENMVEINNLVGVVELESYHQDSEDESDRKMTRQELEDLGLSQEEIDALLAEETTEPVTENVTAETTANPDEQSAEAETENGEQAENQEETSAEENASEPEQEEQAETEGE